ncbi:hypothetical protein Q1695_009315 [Nippostrongylus brasiliensis]|nr:hypothetical protein Q1695_009315 [Nippostrongylus brasiliensis]
MSATVEHATAEGALAVDSYRVRWPLNVSGLADIKEHGQQVKVTDIVKSKDVTINGKSVTVKGLAQTSAGIVPLSYLEPKPKKTSKLENRVFEEYPIHDEVASGRWWVGRISPVEVGVRLAADSSLVMGTYAVCQPPEWEPLEKGKWAEFALVVRNVSGKVDQWMYEWDINNKYNLKFGKKFKEREIGQDIIRGPPAGPIPPIAYYTIKRTKEGLFYLVFQDSFNSIDLLLSFYYKNLLPLKGEKDGAKHAFPLVLRGTSFFGYPPHNNPKPLLGVIKEPEYIYKERSPMRLILGDQSKSLEQYKPRITKKPIFADHEQRESLYRAYFHYNGSYHPVTLRKMRPKLFNRKTFDKDIRAPQSGCCQNGYNFLSHIVAFGHHDEVKYSNWIAYEFITGSPLDRCLQRLKYLNNFMSMRQKSEILYQVAAGMRFLELNGLCHRHLRASNIIVNQSTNNIYAVKITDYMVTYHFLDEDAVESINMSDLDWPWWAPECVQHRVFDITTDVWAYGCVIFEINHDGIGPYAFQKTLPASCQELVHSLKVLLAKLLTLHFGRFYS